MPLKIIRQDILKIKCDAIVNPTDSFYSHGGGVDAAIHDAAGPELFKACMEQKILSLGQATLTPSFLPSCKFVIHTAGPVWKGGNNNEEALLRSCYNESLKIAEENKCKSVAFPLVSSGSFGFPKDRVLKIAVDVIGEFLLDSEMLVYLVVYDKTAYTISEKLFLDIASFIDDKYVEENTMRFERACEDLAFPSFADDKAISPRVVESTPKTANVSKKKEKTLEQMLKEMDKGFADTLFYYIDQKGISDVECYKSANVDKKTFSKIKCNKDYRPSKITAVSFAIALRLDIEQTNRLLKTVGLSLSHSNKFDVIIEYFITTGNYKNIFDVNEVLYKFDQETLGV